MSPWDFVLTDIISTPVKGVSEPLLVRVTKQNSSREMTHLYDEIQGTKKHEEVFFYYYLSSYT